MRSASNPACTPASNAFMPTLGAQRTSRAARHTAAAPLKRDPKLNLNLT